MTKTYSPQVEAALDDAAEAPVLLTCDDRPSMVALAEGLFDTLVETSGVKREDYLLRAVPRPKGPAIMLVLEEKFAKLRTAFVSELANPA